MSFWDKSEEDEDNMEDEEEEFKNVNDRIIFLIDARSSMLEKNLKGESHLLNCLRVALEVLKTKIIAQDNSSVGVTFFGTREKDSTETTDGLYSLFNLGPPSAERIRKLKALIDDSSEFENGIGSQPLTKKFCPLKQALWFCSQSFATKDMKKTDFKRIWLFTNDDNPNSHSIMEQKAIVTVARDCSQAGIEISLWHLNPKNDIFNPRVFYFQLLVADGSTGDDDDLESSIDNRMLSGGFDGFDALLASVRRKEYRKRRLGSTKFALGKTAAPSDSENAPDLQHMAVHIYKTVQIVKKPYHTWLHAVNNEPLKSVTHYYSSATGEVLPSERIRTYIDVAGNHVRMEKETMKELKKSCNIEGVGVRLLYFLPRSELKDHLNVETPYFLYPDEKTVKGSSVLFESLLRESHHKQVIPIVRFNLTASSMARIAALIPQLEVIDESDGCQVTPPGFNVIYLPFAEEVRFNPILNPPPVPSLLETVTAKVSQIIDNLSFEEDFDYSKEVENPALKAYYSTLQAIALNEDELEWNAERDDKLRLNPETLQRVLPLVEELKAEVDYNEDDVAAAAPKSRKRGSASAEDEKEKSSAAAKKRKVATGKSKAADPEDDEDDGGFGVEEIKGLIQSQKIGKCSAAELKEMCRSLGLPVSGTKAALTERIIAKLG